MASGKFLKRLVGKTELEDALERLDTLTKEETLMAVTRNLEVAHHVDVNMTAVKRIVHNIDGNVKDTKALTEDVSDNVKATKHSTHRSLSIFVYVWTLLNLCPKTVTEQLKRSFHPHGAIIDCQR